MSELLFVLNSVIMGKKYSKVSEKQRALEDPAAVCVASDSLHALAEDEGVLESTMSVDEYFDELIDQVRKDYAAV